MEHVEMREWQCHKVVQAGKILEIKELDVIRPEPENKFYGVVIDVPGGEESSSYLVDGRWIEKHKPAVGGYFVKYPDGYISYSPAEAFVGGYTLDEGQDKLKPSEALFGFVGWLTTRSEKVVMSSSDDASPIPPLVKAFCKANSLSDPSDNYSVRRIV